MDTPILKLLTIEDEEFVRESIVAYFEDSGFDVYSAENGEKGLIVFEEVKPDVVLTDLRMPKVSGFDVVRSIHASHPEVPVVVVSGTGVIQDSIEAIRIGAWDYVTKPISDMAVLEHIVKKVLERAELKREQANYRQYLEEEVSNRTKELNEELCRRIEIEKELREKNLKLINSQASLKEHQQQLQASLEEKTILLKEIHHRVKNNLQVMASIISLQLNSIKEESVKENFLSLQARIQSMASVHEALYNSENLAKIDFDIYVRNMISSLMQIYPLSHGLVDVVYDVQKIELGIDIAVPCGLILNELVTNAMKYAFDQGQAGQIMINFTHDEANDSYILIIKDNGKGFAEDFDIKNSKSLGMTLVDALLTQIDAEYSLDRSNGTSWKIVFK